MAALFPEATAAVGVPPEDWPPLAPPSVRRPPGLVGFARTGIERIDRQHHFEMARRRAYLAGLEAERRPRWDAYVAACRALAEGLSSGTVLGWARPEAPHAAPVALPASLWASTSIRSWRRSELLFRRRPAVEIVYFDARFCGGAAANGPKRTLKARVTEEFVAIERGEPALFKNLRQVEVVRLIMGRLGLPDDRQESVRDIVGGLWRDRVQRS